MNLTEINEMKWKVADNLVIKSIKLTSLEGVEQECHFWLMRQNPNQAMEPTIMVTSSYQKWVLKLAKSENFLIQEILVSKGCGNDGFILQIKGKLDNYGLSLRQKRRLVLTPEQKQKRVEQMNRIRKVK